MTLPAAASPAAPVDAAHPYSLIRRTTGRPAYVSGVLPYLDDGTLATGRDECLSAMFATLRRRLADEGIGMAEVVKATVFLTDMTWLPALNEAWAAAFPEPAPARSAVEVRGLPRGAAIELEAILDLAP